MAPKEQQSPAVTGADRGPDQAVEVVNPRGAGGFVLACEHASHFIPPELGTLGLANDLLLSHIVWDPGAAAVARAMSAQLDAPLVMPRVSRLVYDCNRPPQAQSAMAVESEVHRIPGNVGLSAAARQQRVDRYYLPFRDTLADLLEERLGAGPAPALVSVHSFTPVFKQRNRELEIGILHDVDARLAEEMIRLITAEGGWRIGRNEPYGPEDGVTYTLAQHAVPHGLLNVMIEIRNDLIAGAAEQSAIATRLARHLIEARAALLRK